MPSCAIINCPNNSRNTKNQNVSFLCFPKDPEMIEKWKVLCKENVNYKCARVCSNHFQPTHFKDKSWLKNLIGESGNIRVKLKPDAIPMKFNGSTVTTMKTYSRKLLLKDTADESGNKRIKCETEEIPVKSNSSICRDLPEADSLSRNEKDKCDLEMDNVRPNCDSSFVSNLTPSDTSDFLRLDIKQEVSEDGSDVLELQNEIQELKRKLTAATLESEDLNRRLIATNKRYERDIKKNVKQKIYEMLGPFFSPTQIKMYMNPNQQKTRWTRKDIAAAISLKSVSPKAYRYLRNTRQIPLPAFSTLRRWLANFNMDEGILADVLSIMKSKGQSMVDAERATALCFGEMQLPNKIVGESKNERAGDSCKTCQVVIARGLFKKWKQPIFYAFNQDLTKEVLFNIISQLDESGYTVYTVTSDLSPASLYLWKSLNVGYDEGNTSFQHPCRENVNIHVFADVLHVLTLVRDHFIDYGFHVQDKFISSEVLRKLLEIDDANLKNALNLSQSHLNVKEAQRGNVELATQLFSTTNANAIEWCGKRGLLDEHSEWMATANFIKTMNNWFDTFNSDSQFGPHITLDGFGIHIPEQTMLLNEVTATFQNMRIEPWKELLPFQKSVLICNASLKNLYRDMVQTFNPRNSDLLYITTKRLNHEVLRNLFSYIQCVGDSNDTPTKVHIRYRLRWYMLGRHSSEVVNMGTGLVDKIGDDCCLTSDIAEDLNMSEFEAPVKKDTECDLDNEVFEEDEEMPETIQIKSECD